MKTSSIVTFTLLAFGALQGAMAESLQERLLKAEMELASATAGGLADQHPNVRSSKAEIGVLEGQPGVRDGKYLKLADAQAVLLEADLAKLEAAGLGPAHPDRRRIEAQMSALLEAKAKAKMDNARIQPGMTYTLDLVGVPATEHKKWKDDYTVSEAGNIHLPMIEQIKVEGLTLAEAAKIIETSLKKQGIFTTPVVRLRPAKND